MLTAIAIAAPNTSKPPNEPGTMPNSIHALRRALCANVGCPVAAVTSARTNLKAGGNRHADEHDRNEQDEPVDKTRRKSRAGTELLWRHE
jgi:hypothetical protein